MNRNSRPAKTKYRLIDGRYRKVPEARPKHVVVDRGKCPVCGMRVDIETTRNGLRWVEHMQRRRLVLIRPKRVYADPVRCEWSLRLTTAVPPVSPSDSRSG